MVSPKHRLSSSESDDPAPKRLRLTASESTSSASASIDEDSGAKGIDAQISASSAPPVITMPNIHDQSRQAIQRSIALVLDHDGFSAITPEALESFTQLVETYLDSMVRETKKFALASRREIPNPVDFEKMLSRHNVPISSLKPHMKLPISKTAIAPTYEATTRPSDDAMATLPLLGTELSGKADKDAKLYIPSAFPDFPSKHTYKFTPQEDVNLRDSKSVREQVARTAQQGEDALRRLVRASKIRKQKEVKNIVAKDRHGKERFRLWESGMRQFMGAEARGESTDQLEIADHSMIVNSDAGYHRKELTRLGKRNIAVTQANGAM